MTLSIIQTSEDMLINSGLGSNSLEFSKMMYNTALWVDTYNEKEILNYKPVQKFVMPEPKSYKKYFVEPHCMKDITDKIADFITQGYNLNVACKLAGYNYNVLRTRFKSEHKAKFAEARKLKFLLNN